MGHYEVPLTVKVAGVTRDQMLDLSTKLSRAIFEVEKPEGVRIDSVGFGRTIETEGVSDMVCPQCGREFTCDQGHTDAHVCRGCHDANIEQKAAEGRKNLLALFDNAGIEHQVWNTGGYVMCHAIPVTQNEAGEYETYILFSEVEELDEFIGFCYYPSEIEVGQTLVLDDGTEVGNTCWFNNQIKDADDPDTAKRIFDWFVPMYEELKTGKLPTGGDQV